MGDPRFRNSTTFSKDYQPQKRGRGKAKATLAKQAFHNLGFSPTETMVAMTQKYMEMIEKDEDWDGNKLKTDQKEKWINKVLTTAEKLLPYEFAKATPETAMIELPSANDEPEPDKPVEIEVDHTQPLDSGQLAQAQQTMVTQEQARASLEDKL